MCHERDQCGGAVPRGGAEQPRRAPSPWRAQWRERSRVAAISTALGVAALGVGCWPSDASTMLETPGRGTSNAASGTNAATDPCATGGTSELVQARVILELDGKPSVWIDVEVQGAEHEARSACEALVARSMAEADATGAPAPHSTADAGAAADPRPTGASDAGSGASARLQAELARPCSTKAIPVAAVSSPARLIERTELGPLDLSIAARSTACPSVEPGSLRAVVLRQSAQTSMEQCEATRTALEAEAAEAAREAESAAVAWLDGAIELAEKRAAARCGARALVQPPTGAPTAAPSARGDEADAPTAPESEAPPSAARLPSEQSGAIDPAPTSTASDPACEGELRLLELLRDRRARIRPVSADRDGGAEPDLGGQNQGATSRTCHRGVSSPPR